MKSNMLKYFLFASERKGGLGVLRPPWLRLRPGCTRSFYGTLLSGNVVDIQIGVRLGQEQRGRRGDDSDYLWLYVILCHRVESWSS